VRYLTLPTRVGSVTLNASRVATIEPTGERACKIHLRKANVPGADADKFTHEGYGASETHNVFEVKWNAGALRNVIAHMADGDHFDPWNLETLEDE
jgi:hypothetical protein